MKNISRALSLILALTLALAILIVPASAASVPFSPSKGAKTYCLSSSGRETVYTDPACTKTNGVEYIDCASDEIVVLEYNETYQSCLVRYPVPGGTKDRWIKVSKIIPGSFTNARVVTLTKDVQGYKFSTGSAQYGYGEAGDVVWLLGERDGRTFTMWAVGNSCYRIAACNTAELNAAISAAKSATNTTQSGNSISYNKFVEMVEPFLRDRNHAPGATWDSNRTPDWSSWTSYGCCSFCCDYAKKVFGEEDLWEGKKFHNAKEIRYGDVLEFENSPHYVVVLNNNNGDLLTIEGNWGGKVVAGHFYSVRADGVVLRNGTPFRTLEAGYHFT